jgi:hypothetical protein
MKKSFLLLAVVVSTSVLAWEKNNDPKFFSTKYEYRFDRLPTAGELTLDKTPWHSTYWPSMYGGISFRWNDPNAFTLKADPEDTVAYIKSYFTPKNEKEGRQFVRAMSAEQIARLSPTEKYDIYMGRYDFKLTNEVKSETGPHKKDWEGVCHGWTSAAQEFHEPVPMTVYNPDGVEVRFGSADIKALLSYYHAQLTKTFPKPKLMTARIGNRCNVNMTKPENPNYNPNAKDPFCEDVNPGAFHVVISNQLGIMNEGFGAEVDFDIEVWNQPVHKFESVVVDQRLVPQGKVTPGTVRQAIVETKMYYADDGGYDLSGHDEEEAFYAEWDATIGTAGFREDHKEYKYVVDIDRSGRIIGGTWLSDIHPDFLWKKIGKGFVEADKISNPAKENKTWRYLVGLKKLAKVR